MLLAELIVRHTRRHMPTRRVALESAYLPTSGPAHGVALLAAVMATNLPAIDDDERELLTRLVEDARGGLSIPRIALRHRLQTRRARPRPIASSPPRRGRPARARARRARRADSAGARRGDGRGLVAGVGAHDRDRRAAAGRERPMGRARARCRGPVRRARHVGLPPAAARGGRRVAHRAARPTKRVGRAWPPTSAGRWRCSGCGRAWTSTATT